MLKRQAFLLVAVAWVMVLAACGGAMPASGPADAQPASANAGTHSQPDAAVAPHAAAPTELSYPIVDTGQTACYDNNSAIACPAAGEPFYGQDAHVAGNAPSYTNNGDGTVTDDVTGIMWQQSPDTDGDGDINADDKFIQADAVGYCEALTLAGYDDWQLPSVKQLYSLIDFRGADPAPESTDTFHLTPFIDTQSFDFAYGDTDAGERVIDAQFASSTLYVATTMNGLRTMFGVNLADGRIKGYGLDGRGGEKMFYTLCTRNVADYGVNDFVDNGDGTVTDRATGLMWTQDDSGVGLAWEVALAWVQQMNAEKYRGYSDWRLPNAKELQGLVDYTRAPAITHSAAIDPVFNVTAITNEAGQTDYPFYWTSTTFLRSDGSAANAVYVAFGRGLGSMDGTSVIDVHGAGCQRSDPKEAGAGTYPSWGHGPQGDVRRVYNYVRLVRGGTDGPGVTGGAAGAQTAPSAGDAGPGRLPPAAALDACTDLAQGAACSFTTPDGEISGTCRDVPAQSLACVPEGGPGSGPSAGP
jgi:hypothetical protein